MGYAGRSSSADHRRRPLAVGPGHQATTLVALGQQTTNQKRLFSGLLKCGCCGGGMTISRGDRYYCSARREKSTCNADRGIRVHELEQRVLTRLRKEGHGAMRRLAKELQDVERGIKRCLDFITGGEGDPGSVRDQFQ